MFRYFKDIMELTELKKIYRELAKEHHPDNGGNAEVMQEINTEYEKAYKFIEKNGYNQKETENEDIEKFMKIIQNIVIYDFLDIEIIGSWLWVGGNTYSVKDKLNELGLKWHSKKKLWFWYEGEYKRYGKKEYSMEEIREKYGSEKVKTKGQYKLD